MKSILLTVLIVVGMNAWAVRADEGLFLSLNQEGLNLMAEEIASTQLQAIVNEPLPNYEDEVSGGVKVKAEGMKYSAAFGEMVLKPEAGYLALALNVDKVSVFVGKAQFKKKVIVNVSSTCKNTTVEVVNGTVNGKLRMKVVNGRLALDATTISFPITKQSYKVHGPSECSGFLVGGLIKSFVHSTLKKSKDVIEKQLNKKLQDLVPSFETKVNELVKQEIPIKVPGLFPAPHRDIALKTWPYDVVLAKEGVAFTLGVGVSQPLSSRGFEFGRASLRGSEVGEAGVNPALLNEVMESLLKEMPEWQEIDESKAPGVSEQLNVENLSAIWPDLKTLALTSSKLKLLVGFEAAPKFAFEARGARLKITVPMKMKFMVEQQNQWVSYFNLTLKVEVTTELEIIDSLLQVKLDSDMMVTVGGNWENNYTPNDPLFEKEVAEVVFASLFEYLYASGPVVEVKIPTFEVGGAKLAIDAPYVQKPFLRVKLQRP